MKTHQITQKTDNLKEHLTTLIQGVDDKAKELTRISGRVETSKEEVKQLNKEVKEVKKLLKDKLDELYETEFLISQAKERAEQDLESISKREAELILILENKKLSLSSDIKVLEDKLNLATVNFERSRGVFEDELNNLHNRLTTLGIDEVNAQETYQALLLRIIEREKYLGFTENQIKNTEDKLSEANLLLSKRLTEYDDVILNLEEREKLLSVRENDARIITQRLKVLYKKFYPNAELKI